MIRGLLLATLFVLFTNVNSLAQFVLSGVVNEVHYGRTITVIGNRGLPFDVRLGAIETPEEGQFIADTVKDHLGKLLQGNAVTFRSSSSVGQRPGYGVNQWCGRKRTTVARRGRMVLPCRIKGSHSEAIERYRNAEALAKRPVMQRKRGA
jgi:endonuclease YncB( thermonuclease family)